MWSGISHAAALFTCIWMISSSPSFMQNVSAKISGIGMDSTDLTEQQSSRQLRLPFLKEIMGFINGSPDPCIVREVIQAGSADCEKVVIPEGLCQTCGVNTNVRPENGDYVNCLFLSNLETTGGTINRQCMSKLDEYLDLNPCDSFRRKGMRRYKRWTSTLSPARGLFRRIRGPSRQIMDAFIYALCELPCDCIPQYNADITTPTMDVYRGNCQGHAEVDLCAVYPNIKLIHGQYTNLTLPESILDLPKVCPTIKQWRKDTPGPWFDLTPTRVDPSVVAFLNYTLDATEITHFPSNDTQHPLWQQCFYLESTQERIIPISRG
jgi:hypothetical protein